MSVQQYSEIPFEIFTVDDLYTPEELQAFYDYVELSDVKNKTFTSAGFKNGKMIEPSMSQLMYSKIKEVLPAIYTDRCNVTWIFEGSPKYIMYAKVDRLQSFGLHTDTGIEFDAINERYSKFTVLTYLNNDYEEGKTTFYNDRFQQTAVIQPRSNRTLIFDINLFHKGEQVIKGSKYWIGTELVCKKIIS